MGDTRGSLCARQTLIVSAYDPDAMEAADNLASCHESTSVIGDTVGAPANANSKIKETSHFLLFRKWEAVHYTDFQALAVLWPL